MFDVRVLWWAAALCIMCQGSNSVQASSRANSHLTSTGLTLFIYCLAVYGMHMGRANAWSVAQAGNCHCKRCRFNATHLLAS
jgi:hypothetical protein